MTCDMRMNSVAKTRKCQIRHMGVRKSQTTQRVCFCKKYMHLLVDKWIEFYNFGKLLFHSNTHLYPTLQLNISHLTSSFPNN